MAGWAGGGGEGKDNCLGRHFSGGTILGVYFRGRGNFPEHNFLGGFFWGGLFSRGKFSGHRSKRFPKSRGVFRIQLSIYQ